MLSLQDIRVSYDGRQPILKDISLSLPKAAIVGIIGPNGAGKSTLMKAMIDLLPHTGELVFGEKELSKQLKNVAYIAQKSSIDMTFPITVRDCVALGCQVGLGLFKRLPKQAYQKVDDALEKVGLLALSKRQISQLSGGQFQRMLVARALVQEADLILLVEPFVGIDMVSEQLIMELLKSQRDAGKLILVVHHDLSKVSDYFDQVILLNRRLIAYGKTSQVFNRSNLAKTYENQLPLEEVLS
ncbi:MAG: metal ABC transporter ATP-binding protein [Streptococcus hyointestinalis]|nr:metal ABC transporter ATP-binding protein [Streptococcus hyointestinalis]MDD6385341.1 metal ABC transporter ATP-binding protein [Streptococcus hyointestinalis]